MTKYRTAQQHEIGENGKAYAGVEFGPAPAELATALSTLTKILGPFARLAPDEFGIRRMINL